MPVQAIETKYLLSGNVFKIDFKINGHCLELKKERKFKKIWNVFLFTANKDRFPAWKVFIFIFIARIRKCDLL